MISAHLNPLREKGSGMEAVVHRRTGVRFFHDPSGRGSAIMCFFRVSLWRGGLVRTPGEGGARKKRELSNITHCPVKGLKLGLKIPQAMQELVWGQRVGRVRPGLLSGRDINFIFCLMDHYSPPHISNEICVSLKIHVSLRLPWIQGVHASIRHHFPLVGQLNSHIVAKMLVIWIGLCNWETSCNGVWICVRGTACLCVYSYLCRWRGSFLPSQATNAVLQARAQRFRQGAASFEEGEGFILSNERTGCSMEGLSPGWRWDYISWFSRIPLNCASTWIYSDLIPTIPGGGWMKTGIKCVGKKSGQSCRAIFSPEVYDIIPKFPTQKWAKKKSQKISSALRAESFVFRAICLIRKPVSSLFSKVRIF